MEALAAPPPPGPVRVIADLPRRPGRYAVTIGDVGLAPVSVETIAELRLRVGADVTAEVVQRLVAASRATACYDAAAAALARKGRPRRDLERWLSQRDHDAADIAWACDRLAGLGLLDDEAFARAFVSGPAKTRGYGPRRIVAELRRRGVSGSLVDRVMASRGEDALEADVTSLDVAAARRARSLRGLEPAVASRRLTAWLVRRGFGAGDASRAARRALAAEA